MEEFIAGVLHQNIAIKPYDQICKLPLVLQGSYNLFLLTIDRQSCLLAEPREEIGLVTLRKQQRRLEHLTELYCVLYLKELGTYQRDKMLEEGIPFIWENHQVYMPFLGILLRQNDTRALKPCTEISFLTQKLLLSALYQQWENVTVTKAAELLNVTKMSITRCYDEIESLRIPLIHRKGRTRLLCSYSNKRKMWDLIYSHLRNPLIHVFYLAEDLDGDVLKSGISALCEYSMLEDEEYPTYAVIKSQLAELNIKNRKQVPDGETPACMIQELGYMIDYRESGIIDPLTVAMLMKPDEEEPRISKAVEEMLEEYVW